jgi:nucleoside 2-deoxyribosyltransferase
MDNTTLLQTLLLSIILILVVVIVAFFAMKNVRERSVYRYDEYEKRMEMEKMREYFERQINGLTEKMLNDESRWKSVNHLLLESQNYDFNKQTNISTENEFKESNLSEFFKDAGISKNDLTIEKDLVFVLTPFHADERNTYETIKDVCNNVSLRCERGDETFITTDILPHVLKLIFRARVVIVNLNGRNPNVFYELGIAHALGKPTILLSKSFNELPFDLKSKRIIIYNDFNELKIELYKTLTHIFVKK